MNHAQPRVAQHQPAKNESVGGAVSVGTQQGAENGGGREEFSERHFVEQVAGGGEVAMVSEEMEHGPGGEEGEVVVRNGLEACEEGP